jgi:uncharacterized protein with beta-barrel porin domain
MGGFTNSSIIDINNVGGGGGGGGAGGFGAVVTGSSIGSNISSMTGGDGGAGGGALAGPAAGGSGGAGGTGVAFVASGAGLTNNGTAQGGNGGKGGNGGTNFFFFGGFGGNGATGGSGVAFLGASATLTNNNLIQGGNGGKGGDGGVGGSAGATGSGGSGGTGGTGVAFLASGGTLSNTGTIQGGNGGAAGIGNAGRLQAVQQNGAGGGGVSGSGLAIINGGTITGGLAGDGVTQANAITFTGGVNSLTLQAGSIINGNVTAFSAADTLALGGSANGTFNAASIGPTGQYQGFGAFDKTGTSTWTLSGTGTYTGATTINGGTLLVNGSIATSAAFVNTGGTLAGTGTVGNVTVHAGGIFAPGPTGAPGSLAVSGNLAFTSGAIYLVNVTSANASAANVSGVATLTGGSVRTVFSAGSQMGRSYTILTSAGLVGTFGGVSGNVPAGFIETLSYTGNNVLLNVTTQLGGTGTPGNGGQGGGNQQNVVNSLVTYFNNGGMLPPALVAMFGLTGDNLKVASSQLSGEAATGAQSSAFQLMTGFLGLLTDPFDEGHGGGGNAIGFAAEDATLPPEIASAYAAVFKAPPRQALPFEQRWNIWGSGFGGANRTNGDPVVGGHDLAAGTGGFAAGADYHVTPFTTLGFALAGAGTNWSLAQGLGGGRSDAVMAGIYGKTTFGAAYVAASLAFADHWMSTDRISFASDQLTAKFNAQSYGGRVEAGYRFASPLVAVTPYAAVNAQAFVAPTYNEQDVSGGGFGLTYAGHTATDIRGEAGARFDRVTAIDPTTLLVLRGKLGYAHDWLSDPSQAAAFQALPGASFIVNGAAPAHDSGLVAAGAELRFANGVSLAARFDGEFAAHSQTYAGTGTVRYSW